MILLYLSLKTEKALICQVTVRLSPPTPSALKFPYSTTQTTGLQRLSFRTASISSARRGRLIFDPHNGCPNKVRRATALTPGCFKNPFHQALIFRRRTTSVLTGSPTCRVCELSQMRVPNQAPTLKGVRSRRVKARRDSLGVKRSRQRPLKKFP